MITEWVIPQGGRARTFAARLPGTSSSRSTITGWTDITLTAFAMTVCRAIGMAEEYPGKDQTYSNCTWQNDATKKQPSVDLILSLLYNSSEDKIYARVALQESDDPVCRGVRGRDKTVIIKVCQGG